MIGLGSDKKGENIDRCVVINNAVFKIRAEQYQINKLPKSESLTEV